MFLPALLLAAAVQAAPAAPEPPPALRSPGVVHGRIIRPARSTCRPLQAELVDKTVDGRVVPLGEASPGSLHYAVMRSVGGCPVPTPIRQVRPAR